MSHLSTLLPTGHTVEFLKEEDNERIHKSFPTYGNMIRLHPGGWFFEECITPIIERVYSFQFKSTDAIAMTHPKSGSTWTQEVLWTFLHNSNLDNPAAKIPLDFRTTMIDADFFFNFKYGPKLASTAEFFKNAIRQVDPDIVDDKNLLFTYTELCLKHPRVIKTHLPPSLLPAKALETSKILYVARDPRDVITSRFYYYKLLKVHSFSGTFDEYFEHFIKEELFYNPFWKHMKEAWDLRHHPNFLFILYEELLTVPLREYERINQFLGLNLTETQVKNIIEYTSFDNMKKRNTGNEPSSDEGNLINEEVKKSQGGFFRKGKIGDWKDKFSQDQVEKINNWTKKSTKDFPKDMPYLVKE